MQIVFFIAFFGFLSASAFNVISLMATETRQMNALHVAVVEDIFADIEFAVNELIIPNNARVDPAVFPNFIASTGLQEFSTLLSWSGGLLENDPWGMPYTILVRQAPAGGYGLVYADGTNAVNAPVLAVALISAGPDRALSAALNTAVTNVDGAGAGAAVLRTLGMEAPAGSDDIVHTFSTRTAMAGQWRQAAEFHERIMENTRQIFLAQYNLFSPQIDAYIANLVVSEGAGVLSDPMRLNQWWNNPPTGIFGTPGYPTMPIDEAQLGIDQLQKYIEPFILDLVPVGAAGSVSRATVVDVRVPSAAGWGVNYRFRINGQALVF